MKKATSLLLVLLITVSLCFSANADGGKVIYDGNAKEFIFEANSIYSPTDLFTGFKSVMPGDSLTEKISIKNDSSNEVKVKIYLRSLGADESSIDFLSKLTLQVKKSDDNEMAYMFDSSADKAAQLSEWVCLGTLYSGGEVNIDVTLNVPVELDNNYQNKIGYIDWEFMIEEYPIEDTDPKPPQTGNNFNMVFWISASAFSLAMILILLFYKKKQQKDTQA